MIVVYWHIALLQLGIEVRVGLYLPDQALINILYSTLLLV